MTATLEIRIDVYIRVDHDVRGGCITRGLPFRISQCLVGSRLVRLSVCAPMLLS